MRDSSKAINKISGRINQVWGGRHYKCEITSFHYFMNAYKYVYQNPIRSGLCQRVEDWPFSTLHGLLGVAHLFIPTAQDTLLFPDLLFDETTLDWLNRPVLEIYNRDISSALVKKQFKLRKTRHGKPNILEKVRI
ncbi:MAG: hypothetical protein BroJett040_14950 [Oligoflexia bacterium]|nr:MAG: hypothetical protein BroJett040_14950 [Oligoflexia bacterium]